MIDVHCRTNLDLFNEQWPTRFAEIPRIGERIESLTNHGMFRLQLKVVGITWKEKDVGTLKPLACPSLELCDPLNRSIKEFYEWYAPLVGKDVSYFI